MQPAMKMANASVDEIVDSYRVFLSRTPPPRAALHGYNTWVEVSLPYTLHLPSGMVFEMNHQQIGKAAVIARKVWTKLATGSNEAEIYAENQSLYYGPVQPISPFIPQAPELGPWPHFTGINVEIAKDIRDRGFHT